MTSKSELRRLAIQDPEQLIQRIGELERCLSEFLEAVDITDEASVGVFQIAHIHGLSYTGPTHTEAKNAARSLLKKLEDKDA